jgi:hypothetical protein
MSYKPSMQLFLPMWSLISPGCVGLIAAVMEFYQVSWYPAYPDMRWSIAVYLSYWLLLGTLQGGLLFWRFHDRQWATRWAITTSVTGFLVMLLHDLTIALLRIDTEGQGGLILFVSLPCLVVLGSLILGAIQFLLLRDCLETNQQSSRLTVIWCSINLLSWMIGFSGSVCGSLPILLLLVASGSLLKGRFIQKYFQ